MHAFQSCRSWRIIWPRRRLSRQFGNGTVDLTSDAAGAVCQCAGSVEQAQVVLEVVGVPVALIRGVFAHCL